MKHLGRSARTASLSGRWLRFELLERRDLLAVIRIVNWNTANFPNTPTNDSDFLTVLEAIGNESVQGTAKRIDILALQETDTTGGVGGSSIARVESILDTRYPSTNYSFIVTGSGSGGDETGFVYDTSAVSVISSLEVPGSLTHRILRAQFRPAGTGGESDLWVYSVHLKSGTSGADATKRGAEAAILRANADALGDGAHVLFVGDFNMKTSGETAWTSFVSPGFAQLQDVANAPGNWFDKPEFKHLHSQDPGAAMDDRFDMQFASGEFFNGFGLEYVANSFHVFGNNGTHMFDGMITTGMGASATVLAALAAASDHLPAVADYFVIGSPQGVLITETGGSTSVSEGGSGDTYNVSLITVPAADVTVTITPNSQVDVGNGVGVPRVLTFTPGNALVPQPVTVLAADDNTAEGAHAGLITHTSASADAAYNGLPIGNVFVSIADNDVPTVVITEIMYNPATNEGGSSLPEWIEVVNAGTTSVDLGGWRFDDEDTTTDWDPIGANTLLHPGQVAVFYDVGFVSEATFRSDWAVPASALLVGIAWGSLLNNPAGVGDEVLQLLDKTSVSQDVVNFDNASPWPSIGESPGGPSIYLKSLALDNSLGANWARSVAGVARAVSPTGSVFSTSDIGSPGRFFLPGDYSLNGYVDAADYVVWRDTLGSADPRADGSGPTVGTPNGVVDQADYDFWRANFGNVGAYYVGGPGSSAGEMYVASGASKSMAAPANEPVTAVVVLPGVAHSPAATMEQVQSVKDLQRLDAAVIDEALVSAFRTPAAVAVDAMMRVGFEMAPRRTVRLQAQVSSPMVAAATNDLLAILDLPSLSGRQEVKLDVEVWDASKEAAHGTDDLLSAPEGLRHVARAVRPWTRT